MQANNTHVSPPSCVEGPVFKPASREDLIAAIEECLKVSDYECSRGAKGPIGEWDVSAVTDMSVLICQNFQMPNGAERFDGDISKWDVSRVTDMKSMFNRARAFNGDISDWDVSRVTNMSAMFYWAQAFNGDISKWDVSRVTDMSYMFFASVFSQTLCGAWRDSKAGKLGMLGRNGKMCSSSFVLHACI